MSTTPTPSPADPSQPADPLVYYQNLFNALTDAYFAATDSQAKTQIQLTKDSVYIIVSGLIHAQLDQDTSQLASLSDIVASTNDELEKLQDEIDKIVHDITVIGNVENAIANVLSLAGKLL